MKKYYFLTIVLMVSLFTKAQTVTAILTNNGVAPISSFTLGKPAGMVFVNTNVTKHLEFSPDVAFNATNGELWFTDLWVRYNWWNDTTKKWLYTIGIDFPSLFGQPAYNNTGEKINQVVIYGSLQGKVKRVVSPSVVVGTDYWYMWCTDMRFGVKGHYMNLFGEWSKKLTSQLTVTTNPNFFYLNYSDGVKGFVGSLGVTVADKKTGLFFGLMGITPITSKQVSGTWNASVGVTKKLF